VRLGWSALPSPSVEERRTKKEGGADIRTARAGVIRDYANSGVGGDEQTDRLFQLAYAKYQVRRFVLSFSFFRSFVATIVVTIARCELNRIVRTNHHHRQEALELYGRKRPDYLLIENWAYAIREHANFNVRINNHPVRPGHDRHSLSISRFISFYIYFYNHLLYSFLIIFY
jgi:hypothetical protein